MPPVLITNVNQAHVKCFTRSMKLILAEDLKRFWPATRVWPSFQLSLSMFWMRALKSRRPSPSAEKDIMRLKNVERS